MSGPLAGFRVIEMVGLGPAPFAAMMLADMGAEVIRVHPLNVDSDIPLLNTKYDVLARSRRSISIDLKADGAVDLVLDLIRKSDAIIEGFRPGVMERLGLGPDVCLARKPELVYGRMTGWGQDGPKATLPGHDINYLSLTGVLNALGPSDSPPPIPLNLVGDFGGGGMLMAFGIVCALIDSVKTKTGQVVDAAMIDGVSLLASSIWGLRAGGAWHDERSSNFLDGAAYFYGTYTCADGKFISVGAIEPKFHKEFLRILGADPSDFNQYDSEQWEAGKAKIASIFLRQSRDHWAALFKDSEACVTPVLDWKEAAEHPHNIARQTFVSVEGVSQPAPAPRFSVRHPKTPSSASRPGADTKEILVEWGIDESRISSLEDMGVI